MRWKDALIGFAAAAAFSLLFGAGFFARTQDRVYDFFLRFRPDREQTDDVVFLDVDDPAIAYNGVFPWPRSITADGLLRLKEYGARAAVFDIEYIDKGPPGVDAVYLNQGLPADFNRSFAEIGSAASDLLSSLKSGRIGGNDIDEYAEGLSAIISGERENLFARAQRVSRDNDLYLIEASRLFGKSWVTLNLRPGPLSGEQAERRPFAEKNFSYPVNAATNASGGEFVDILPPLPGFAEAAKGAGFTNVEVDEDGIRRRIYLTQNIQGHWYLQLAFAPLIDYLGRPAIEVGSREMVLRGAKMPGGEVRDIAIPLDGKSRMLLDWPKEDYTGSYTHLSFADFSLLEHLEAELEQYLRAFSGADLSFFAQFDPSLREIPFLLRDLETLFDASSRERTAALANNSEESFAAMVRSRKESRNLLARLLEAGPAAKINALLPSLEDAYPASAAQIRKEAAYITTLAGYIKIDLDRYEELRLTLEAGVKDKFCILGRVDTATTDIGANPFHGEYVNVGTHGVVLDMILRDSFITPVDEKLCALFALVFVSLFFFLSAKLPPIPRALSGFAAGGLVGLGTAALFRFEGIYAAPLVTILAMVSAVIVREIISYAGSEQEKRFIRKAFSTYVSGDIVKELLADPSRLKLGGAARHMSAIFTDIQGFSSIAEKLDPESLVSLLNRYLTALSDVVLVEKGTIDKYEGDAIIAFFGAPMECPDHAVRACLSAIAMKREEARLNKIIMEEKHSPAPLLTRIGINTGNMVAGNMGTASKMDYTIMGNAVNLAARLEGVNKQYGTWILASDDTIRETGGIFLTRKLDRVRVLGLEEAVRIHELIDTAENAAEGQKKLVRIFHEALEYYENRAWNEAAKGFAEALSIEHGGPSAVYYRRCQTFLQNPPPDAWDGVNNLMEK